MIRLWRWLSTLSGGDAAQDRPRMTFLVSGGVLAFGVLLAVWIMLAGQPDVQDLVAGSCAAAVSVGVGYLVSHQGRALPRLHWADLKLVIVLPRQLVGETWQVFAAVVRGLRSAKMPTGSWSTIDVDVHTAADDIGEGSGWRAARRVAVLTALISVAPNTIAVYIDPEAGTALIHRLVGGSAEGTENPRLPTDGPGRPIGSNRRAGAGGRTEVRGAVGDEGW